MMELVIRIHYSDSDRRAQMTKLVKIITLGINLSALILMIVEVVYFVKYINYAEATKSSQYTIF
jgi:hypothetical protein